MFNLTLRAAKILIIGLNGYGAEIAKNIILAGVKAVTFLDHRNVAVEDWCSQFLAPKESLGKNRAEASVPRAQNLNSMVDVKADTSNVDDKPDTYFSEFNVVCATQCTIMQIKRINEACRKHNVKLFAGDVWGLLGYTFADLVTHEYVEDVVQTKKIQISDSGEPIQKEKFENIVVTEKHTETFVPFKSILNVTKSSLPKDSEVYYMILILHNYREKYGKDPLPSERGSENLKAEADIIIKKYDLEDKIDHLIESDLYAQISPVCAIVGGIMGQEIIKAVSQKGKSKPLIRISDKFEEKTLEALVKMFPGQDLDPDLLTGSRSVARQKKTTKLRKRVLFVRKMLDLKNLIALLVKCSDRVVSNDNIAVKRKIFYKEYICFLASQERDELKLNAVPVCPHPFALKIPILVEGSKRSAKCTPKGQEKGDTKYKTAVGGIIIKLNGGSMTTLIGESDGPDRNIVYTYFITQRDIVRYINIY
ncbi:SUMO-activating enzyme subunit 1 [Melipona quadrifasciata]|uniref:SUMO-activating enzyme subunit 1 n=1 Tax=Melipona quadrifasciata TaxID=166423 RepID=A0A0N0U4X9_9HYME|nr:SUMO-activating enzyme subunit 1 [Melipona quadrifasciata]